MRHLITAYSVSCGILFVIVLQLAQSWITEGYGLNPILAGAFLAYLLVTPSVCTSLWNGTED